MRHNLDFWEEEKTYLRCLEYFGITLLRLEKEIMRKGGGNETERTSKMTPIHWVHMFTFSFHRPPRRAVVLGKRAVGDVGQCPRAWPLVPSHFGRMSCQGRQHLVAMEVVREARQSVDDLLRPRWRKIRACLPLHDGHGRGPS